MPEHRVARLVDLPSNRGLQTTLGATEVAIFRDGECAYALSAWCPHQYGPIADGWVENGRAVCPNHLWNFDLVTGTMGELGTVSIRTYPTVVDGDGWVVVTTPLPERAEAPGG